MSTIYLEAVSGVAGDMLLGALIDAGVPAEALERPLRTLPLTGWSLEPKSVERAGMRATAVEVRIDEHHPHRRLCDIEAILDAGGLSPWVLETARAIFTRLVAAEARVHGQPPEEVYLHEVGAVDAIVDVVGTLVGLESLGMRRFVASPLPLGGGSVRAAHGRLPVPAPATVLLLEGVPVSGGPVEAELVTPTGAAIVTGLTREFGALPASRIRRVGVGAGSRDHHGWPNVLRLYVCEETSAEGTTADSVVVLEANLDDMSPELHGHAIERLLAAGALDASVTPLLMKKGRPGSLLTVLAPPGLVPTLEATIFAETTTLGVRRQLAMRSLLPRRTETVSTPYGEVRLKIASRGGQDDPSPEFEDCRRAALAAGVPLRRVQAAALEAFGAVRPRAGAAHAKD